MSEPEHSDNAEPVTVEGPAPAAESERGPVFPWPPADGAGTLTSFLQTIEQSIRAPAAFFSSMPRGGYLSAFSYFIPVGVGAAGLRLFWRNLFALWGYHPFGLGWESPADRLLDFLLSPVFLVAALFVVACVLHISLKIAGGAHAAFVTTTRVCAFSCAPQLLQIVPVVGSLAAIIGTSVLIVIGLREAHQTTTARAFAALALPFVVLLLLVLVALLLIVLGGLASILGAML